MKPHLVPALVLLQKTGAGQKAIWKTIVGKQWGIKRKMPNEDSKYVLHSDRKSVERQVFRPPASNLTGVHSVNKPKSVIWFMKSLSQRMLKDTMAKLLKKCGTRNYVLLNCGIQTKLTEILKAREDIASFLLPRMYYDLMKKKLPQTEEEGDEKQSEEDSMEKPVQMCRRSSLQGNRPISKHFTLFHFSFFQTTTLFFRGF